MNSISPLSTASSAEPIALPSELPPHPGFVPGIRRAPHRGHTLSPAQTVLAVKNALRYVPPELHAALAPEFLGELRTTGRIYAYRFRPPGAIKARPVHEYRGILEARALQHNIDNNLDFDVALYPYELVTYGETGQVFQNWLQYRLVRRYLEEMTDTQTLVVASGHPLGLFPSRRDAPRVISTNGLLVGESDNALGFHEAAQLGVSNYGQMTAGGWFYIGPQGIVHGTYNTLLGAGRLKLGVPKEGNLAGKLFVSSGLGGMSGAQGKAAVIAGAPLITDHLDPESAAHFATLCSQLTAAGVDFVVNPRLVRGLDYYSRTVFEWVTDRLGAQGRGGRRRRIGHGAEGEDEGEHGGLDPREGDLAARDLFTSADDQIPIFIGDLTPAGNFGFQTFRHHYPFHILYQGVIAIWVSHPGECHWFNMIGPVRGVTIHKESRIPFVEYLSDNTPDFRGFSFHTISVQIKILAVIPHSHSVYRSILISPVKRIYFFITIRIEVWTNEYYQIF